MTRTQQRRRAKIWLRPIPHHDFVNWEYEGFEYRPHPIDWLWNEAQQGKTRCAKRRTIWIELGAEL